MNVATVVENNKNQYHYSNFYPCFNVKVHISL